MQYYDKLFFVSTSRNGLEVAKAGQIADRYSCSMVDRLDSERLRGFFDRRTDVQTDGQTDICDSRVAFATENIQFIE